MNNNRKMTQLQKFNLLLTITVIIVLTNIIS
jgi:hypothetical protein